MHRLWLAICSVAIVATSSAGAQTRSDVLAEQWRQAREAELLATLANANAELTAIRRGATPPAAAPAPARTAGQAAQSAAPTPDPKPENPAKQEAAVDPNADKKVTDAADNSGKFGGLEFGVGISYTDDLGRRDRVASASVVNGIVRVDDENNGNARIMLESHYFFTPCGGFLGLSGLAYNPCSRKADRSWARAEPKWGWGPFVALQPASDSKIIDAIGMGVMVGFRKSETTTQSFNFGVGVVMDTNVKVLGDGVLANQPPPPGETGVRLKDTTQSGLLLISSFSF